MPTYTDMVVRRFWLMALMTLLCAIGAGCIGDEEPEATQQSANVGEFPVISAELGGSYDLAVEVKRGAEVTERNAKVLRFHVAAGETFAAVMRRSDESKLDPFLALYADSDGAKVAQSDYWQALVPMAAEPDAVVVHTSEVDQDFLLYASDLEIEVDGAFQIDLVALDATLSTPVNLSLTNVTTRTMTKWLRADEPEIGRLLGLGAVSEGDDGMLEGHPLALTSLKDRAGLKSFVKAVNGRREMLYQHLVSSDLGADDAALAAEVGSLCGLLWVALRSDAHALR